MPQTIQDLTKKFLKAQAAVREIEQALLPCSAKVRTEQINEALMNLWAEIEAMPAAHKNLTIADYGF